MLQRFKNLFTFAASLPDGVTGNTSRFDREESWFEPLSGNKQNWGACSPVFLFIQRFSVF